MIPAVDDISTIVAAPVEISLGSRACTQCSVPSTFTLYMACQSSGVLSAIVSAPIAPPALATRTSHRSSDSAKASTAARSVTSSWYGTALPPSAVIRAATSARRSARLAVSITRYPALASSTAVAAPMPLLAPVTTAVRSMATDSASRWQRRRRLGDKARHMACSRLRPARLPSDCVAATRGYHGLGWRHDQPHLRQRQYLARGRGHRPGELG